MNSKVIRLSFSFIGLIKRNNHTAFKQSMVYPFKSDNDMITFPKYYKMETSLNAFKIKRLSGGNHRRPELMGSSSDVIYDQNAEIYSGSERVIRIQTEMTLKALELLKITGHKPQNNLILDLGCGSGIGASILENAGFLVIGMDSSKKMLQLFRKENTFRDAVTSTMLTTIPFREGFFGTVISISALQWLLVTKEAHHNLSVLFSSISASLEQGGRAIMQFYPRDRTDAETVVNIAQSHFTNGALICDYPHKHRGKKLFLIVAKT